MVMWTRDTKNKIMFETRQQKNDLFRCPEVRLCNDLDFSGFIPGNKLGGDLGEIVSQGPKFGPKIGPREK